MCLDVINQTWSPMFDMLNVFDVFLPQLLLYPNPTDPLNGEAAALMMREPEQYAARIRDCVQKYANAAAATGLMAAWPAWVLLNRGSSSAHPEAGSCHPGRQET